MTLTKSILAASLVDQLGLSKIEAKDLVEGFYDEIVRALQAGETVGLAGFGEFVDFEPSAALTKATR